MRFFFRSILLLAILTKSVSASGQTLMPRTGIAVSQMTHTPKSPPGTVHSKLGVTIGLGAEFHLVKELRFQVECNYVSKGYQWISESKYSSLQFNYEGTIKHDYLEIPLMIKKLLGKRPVQFYLSLGGYAGIGIGGKARTEHWTYSGPQLISNSDREGSIRYGGDNANNADIYYDKRVDVGVTMGAGVMIFGKVGLDIRYVAGLIDIDNIYDNFKNRTVQAVLFVPLRINPSE